MSTPATGATYAHCTAKGCRGWARKVDDAHDDAITLAETVLAQHNAEKHPRSIPRAVQTQLDERRNYAGITWRGQTQSLQAWAKQVGLAKTTIEHRIQAGWTLDKAMTARPWSTTSRWSA